MLFPLCHPYVAGALSHVEQHLIAADRQIDFSLVCQRDSRTVRMKHLKRCADRAPRDCIEALGPDAREAVTVGGAINEVAVPVPIPPILNNGDPRTLWNW